MVSSAPATRMPASSSCVSRRSTGTFSTSANWLTVTSAMNPPAPRSGLLAGGGFEPMLACRHDERARALGVHAIDLQQIVDCLLGEILTREDAAARQRRRQILV